MEKMLKNLATVMLVLILVMSVCILPVQAEAAQASELEPITFTMFDARLNQTYDDFLSPVAQEIQRRTGVTLQIESAIGGDPNEKLLLLLASGDYPDFICPENTQQYFYDAGALLELEALIKEHGSNLLALYGDYFDRLRWSSDDPGIYKIGSRAVYTELTFPNARTWVQHAVVKEFGYPELKTLQQLEDLIRAYAERYPEINGQPTIPLLAPTEGTRLIASFIQSGAEITGDFSAAEWTIDNENNVSFHIRKPISREYHRWLNKMYNEGLLDPDTFIQKNDEYLAKLASGRALAVIDANWGMAAAFTALKESEMFDRMYGVYPILLDDTLSHKVTRIADWNPVTAIYITTNCKDPVRAVKFFDFIASEEGQILTQWGMEGVHWAFDEEGVRRFLPEVQKEYDTNPNFPQITGVGLYSFPFPQWGSKRDSTGNYVIPDAGLEQVVARYTDVEREVLAGYGAETWLDLFPGPIKDPVGAPVPTPTDADILTKMNSIRNEINLRRVPEAIMAKPEDFDKTWDAYMDELTRNGADEVEAEVTRLLKERLVEWHVVQ